MFGLDYVVFRPHNVFGPRQNIGDRYRNVIGIFMNQILQGQPMTIFGDGTQTRAFSYIDDVAPIMAEADRRRRRRATQVFNVGADTPCSLNDAGAGWLRRAMGVTPDVVHLAPRRRGAARAFVARQDSRACSAHGRRRRCRTGSRQMAAWVRRHGARAERAVRPASRS